MSSTDGLSEHQKEGVAKYQQLREEIDELFNKLTQIDSDKSEHELVIKSLDGLDENRKCWHQVGAVLAEKKVRDVLPVLISNRNKLVDTAKQLNNSIEAKEAEIQKVQKDHGIIVKRGA